MALPGAAGMAESELRKLAEQAQARPLWVPEKAPADAELSCESGNNPKTWLPLLQTPSLTEFPLLFFSYILNSQTRHDEGNVNGFVINQTNPKFTLSQTLNYFNFKLTPNQTPNPNLQSLKSKPLISDQTNLNFKYKILKSKTSNLPSLTVI
ncbi:hypothetical protein NC652_036505 [Populus alba x Populus x berolinensis]|nr:hypothetical protein NC652_036505 [Populus alba x Populus x berolinensis]